MNHLQSANPEQVETIPVHLEHEKKACVLMVEQKGGMQCLFFGDGEDFNYVGLGQVPGMEGRKTV